MARWLVGTSGYVYRDWRTRFYPRALPVRAWLPYYAASFDTVELNSPFYRLPRAATFRAWAAAVPPEFVFAVKASRFLTHVKRLNEPGPPLPLFLRRARRGMDARRPRRLRLLQQRRPRGRGAQRAAPDRAAAGARGSSPRRMTTLSTRCCVAGGGPAGMMLGLLLARAGVEVVVLEKHADFLRDFRGDTIHPSTLEVMHELGLLESFLALPHTQVRELAGIIGGERIPIADFGRLPVRCPFIALMPQWDFLDFLAGHARRYPGFALRISAGVVGLIG